MLPMGWERSQRVGGSSKRARRSYSAPWHFLQLAAFRSLLAATLAQLSSAARDAFDFSSALATSQKGNRSLSRGECLCCCRGPEPGSCLMLPEKERSCPCRLGYRSPQGWGLEGHECRHRSQGGKERGPTVTVTVQILWMRHGYSCSNALNTQWYRKQGPQRGVFEYPDAPLTDAGIHRTQKIRELIRRQIGEQAGSEEELLVFSSYLRRAIETALYTFPLSRVRPIPYVGEEGAGMMPVNTPLPYGQQAQAFELLPPTDANRIVFNKDWRAYADREQKTASDFDQFLNFLPRAIQQLWSGGDRSGGKPPSSVIPVVIVSHGWFMQTNLMCTGHPNNNEVWSEKYTFQWGAWDARLHPVEGSCAKVIWPDFLPNHPRELCAQDVARCDEGPARQDWRPSGLLKSDEPVCQGFDAAGASTVVHRDVYYGELYTGHDLLKASLASMDVAHVHFASLTVSLNWLRDGGVAEVDRAGAPEQLRHYVSGGECPFYLGPPEISHGGKFAVSWQPPKTIYVSTTGYPKGWDFNVPVMCRLQAPCTFIQGETISSSFPCSCGTLTCNTNEVCTTGWGATVDRCTPLTPCTRVDGTGLSAIYPCGCGGVVCPHQFGVCNAAKNTCEAPCTSLQPLGLSSIYPCNCAGDVCSANEVCNPLDASQKCKLLPCTETTGATTSIRYPCACGASTCNMMGYSVFGGTLTLTSYGVCNMSATAPPSAVNGLGACSACADADDGRTDTEDKGCRDYVGARCGLFDTDDFVASELCCACGGGAEPCTFKHGTAINDYYPCVCNAAVCVRDSGQQTTYGQCNWEQSKCSPACRDTDVDFDDAVDAFEDGCEDYAEGPSSCGKHDTDDFTSSVLCCACGGGKDTTEFAGGFGGQVTEPEPMEVVEAEDQRLEPPGKSNARTKQRRRSKGESGSRRTTKRRRAKAFFVVKAALADMFEPAQSLSVVGTLKKGARVQWSAVEIKVGADRVMQPIRLTGAVDEKFLSSQQAPVTTLSQAVQAGDIDLNVASEEGFSVGGRVVISGGGDSETRTIASFGSIVLTEPLQHSYLAGSTVTGVVIEGSFVVTSPSTVYVPFDSRSYTWNAIGELNMGARVQQAASPIQRSDRGVVMQPILVNGAVKKNTLEEESVAGRPAGSRRAGGREAGGPHRLPRRFRRRGRKPYEARIGMLETSDVEAQEGGRRGA